MKEVGGKGGGEVGEGVMALDRLSLFFLPSPLHDQSWICVGFVSFSSLPETYRLLSYT